MISTGENMKENSDAKQDYTVRCKVVDKKSFQKDTWSDT